MVNQNLKRHNRGDREMKINREYLESLSEENAACVMRASCVIYDEDTNEQLSIVDNVTLAIDYAIRRDEDGNGPEIVY
jgi:hypothetical protein